MEAAYKQYILNFKRPGGTSRGVLHTKETWLLQLVEGDKTGIGECAVFRGLSVDDLPDYEKKLQWLVLHINEKPSFLFNELQNYPSIQFGLETALASLRAEDKFQPYPSAFSMGQDSIPINGLVWMGDLQFMKDQIRARIEDGFKCIKLKIGALDFAQELNLLASIRKEFSQQDIELRVDANGAFIPSQALEKLKQLSTYNLHSIEQPIKPRNWEEMASLCEYSPLDIALDEELIGIFNAEDKQELLSQTKPQYIILKPALVGGFKGSEEWITTAEHFGVQWWVTSALESNIGLNAIAQWTYGLSNKATQGLGTGSLFTNNFDSPLMVENGHLHYQQNVDWKFSLEL